MNQRGIITDDNTHHCLMGESYYAIINGYKEPFLDKEAMQSSDQDVYKNGTTFNDIHTLFLFDRELRAETFKALIKAESILKSVTVYSFCEKYRDQNSYLSSESYVDGTNYLVPVSFRKNIETEHQKQLNELLRRFKNKTEDSGHFKKDFVKHYIRKHDHVPLWVLQNDLTFGEISHFYQLQKRHIQDKICKRVADYRHHFSPGQERIRITPLKLLRIFNTLVRL